MLYTSNFWCFKIHVVNTGEFGQEVCSFSGQCLWELCTGNIWCMYVIHRRRNRGARGLKPPKFESGGAELFHFRAVSHTCKLQSMMSIKTAVKFPLVAFKAPCSALDRSLPRALQWLKCAKNSEIKGSWIINFAFLAAEPPTLLHLPPPMLLSQPFPVYLCCRLHYIFLLSINSSRELITKFFNRWKQWKLCLFSTTSKNKCLILL